MGLGRVEDAWTDQVFAVRQVCEKYLANGKDVFWTFMDLEKAFDTIDRHVADATNGGRFDLSEYGIVSKFSRHVQTHSLYKVQHKYERWQV